RGADDFVGYPVDLFLFVPGTIRIEFHVESSSQHFSREFLGVVACGFLTFAERVVFAQIPISVAVRRDGDPDTGSQKAVWLARRIFRYYGKNHFTVVEIL